MNFKGFEKEFMKSLTYKAIYMYKKPVCRFFTAICFQYFQKSFCFTVHFTKYEVQQENKKMKFEKKTHYENRNKEKDKLFFVLMVTVCRSCCRSGTTAGGKTSNQTACKAKSAFGEKWYVRLTGAAAAAVEFSINFT